MHRHQRQIYGRLIWHRRYKKTAGVTAISIDLGEDVTAGVSDNGGQFGVCVVDIDAHLELRITGETWFMKNTLSQKSRDTIPLTPI